MFTSFRRIWTNEFILLKNSQKFKAKHDTGVAVVVGKRKLRSEKRKIKSNHSIYILTISKHIETKYHSQVNVLNQILNKNMKNSKKLDWMCEPTHVYLCLSHTSSLFLSSMSPTRKTAINVYLRIWHGAVVHTSFHFIWIACASHTSERKYTEVLPFVHRKSLHNSSRFMHFAQRAHLVIFPAYNFNLINNVLIIVVIFKQ